MGKRLRKRSPNTMFYMYHLAPPGAGKPHLQLLTWHPACWGTGSTSRKELVYVN